jgi:hypothetical protein
MNSKAKIVAGRHMRAGRGTSEGVPLQDQSHGVDDEEHEELAAHGRAI